MSNWHASHSGDWTAGPHLLAGHGGGIGEFRASYAIDLDAGSTLNGRITADIALPGSRTSGAGLICRADRNWNFVAFYTAPEEAGSADTFARIGVFRDGAFTPVAVMPEPLRLGGGFNRFTLEFFSGTVRGEIQVDERVHELQASCPHIPLPGHAGVLKLYGASVLIKDVHTERSLMPFVSPTQRPAQEFSYDVFLCHSSRDADEVKALAEVLKQHEITYWLDSEQIEFGAAIVQAIEAGLQASRFILPCVSPNLTQSGWTRAEFSSILNAEFSGDFSRRVIPLMLPAADVADIPLLIRDKRRVSYANKVEFDGFLNFLGNR